MKIDAMLAPMVSVWLCLFFSATPAITVTASEQSPKMVILTGTLRSKTEWGPPGYGETPKVDGKVAIFVLKLSKPETALQLSIPPGEKEERCFSEVQLWCDSAAFPRCDALLKKSVGRRITVSGQAARATEPTDYLPVVIHVHLIANE